MSWNTLHPTIRQTAERVLTEKQLDAYKHWENGLGYGRIATLLGISPSSARDRVHRALSAIERHLERDAA